MWSLILLIHIGNVVYIVYALVFGGIWWWLTVIEISLERFGSPRWVDFGAAGSHRLARRLAKVSAKSTLFACPWLIECGREFPAALPALSLPASALLPCCPAVHPLLWHRTQHTELSRRGAHPAARTPKPTKIAAAAKEHAKEHVKQKLKKWKQNENKTNKNWISIKFRDLFS